MSVEERNKSALFVEVERVLEKFVEKKKTPSVEEKKVQSLSQLADGSLLLTGR